MKEKTRGKATMHFGACNALCANASDVRLSLSLSVCLPTCTVARESVGVPRARVCGTRPTLASLPVQLLPFRLFDVVDVVVGVVGVAGVVVTTRLYPREPVFLWLSPFR